MKALYYVLFFLCACLSSFTHQTLSEDLSEGVCLPLFYWQEDPTVNFGDYLSRVIIERVIGGPVSCYTKKGKDQGKKLLAIGSILYFASDEDVIWGSGVNGKTFDKKYYNFTNLDVRAVRGPITRKFLMDQFQIECPEVYGDPALLFPYLFPEFKKSPSPSRDYLIIPHYTDQHLFPKDRYNNVVYTSEPWQEIVRQILDSKFVIGSSLHALVVAEAFGIPARLLRISENKHNHILKYYDYYLGTNRPHFQFATSVEEALEMGGEPPIQCDLEKLYKAFPSEFWPHTQFPQLNFNISP